jgi:hypothetical protein
VGGSTIWETHDLTAMDALQTTHWTVGALGVEETVVHDVISPPTGPHLYSIIGDRGGFRHDDFDVSPLPFLNPKMVDVASLDYAASNPLFVARVGALDYAGNLAPRTRRMAAFPGRPTPACRLGRALIRTWAMPP